MICGNKSFLPGHTQRFLSWIHVWGPHVTHHYFGCPHRPLQIHLCPIHGQLDISFQKGLPKIEGNRLFNKLFWNLWSPNCLVFLVWIRSRQAKLKGKLSPETGQTQRQVKPRDRPSPESGQAKRQAQHQEVGQVQEAGQAQIQDRFRTQSAWQQFGQG